MYCMQAKQRTKKTVDICSVGSGTGHEGYIGQVKESARRKAYNAVEAKERCQAINAELGSDKVSCKLDSKGDSLILRFTAPLRSATDKPTHTGGNTKQYTLGCGLSATEEGFNKAVLYARQISNQLKLKLFTWEWYDAEIKGIETTANKPVAVRLCGEMLAELKQHYLAESQNNKHPEVGWDKKYWDDLREFKADEPLTEAAIKRVFATTAANTYSRSRCFYAIQYFLDYFNLLPQYEPLLKKYRKSTKYEQRDLKLPNDDEIEAFVLSIKPLPKTQKKNYQSIWEWRWTFGMIATYGLRPHEALNILNLYEPYSYYGKLIPALNDPGNKTNMIVTDGKTGMRLAMPLSPASKDWVALFDLKNPLPKQTEIKDKLNLSRLFCNVLERRGFDYNTYSFRHAFNHRCRVRGINTSDAAKTLGHSEKMNSTTYSRQMRGDTSATILENALTKLTLQDTEKHTIETLKLENELLRAHNLQLTAKVAELERRLSILVQDA